MPGSSIALRGVGKIFRGRVPTEALRDVNLTVAGGEFLTLVGPSGCGKSSLLNIVAGLEPTTSGSVVVDGNLVSGPGPDRILVFQDGALFPWLDVRGNVEFGMRMARIPGAARTARTREALRTVQLERFARARIHELSGGMKQRVALARALVLQPRALLMDEPFGSLDAQMRDELLGTVQDLWAQSGATILFVTHNVREAACLGDRVVVLSHRPGTVKGIIENPARRPRKIEDPPVMEKAHEINTLLAEEIRWVRERELER